METQVIEINGVKMEVDMRHAKRIDTMRVGTKVKVLIKSDYSAPAVHSGVVVGFEPFESIPTIIVCYLDVSYSDATLKFAYINKDTKDKYDIVVSVDEELPITKSDVLAKMDREIEKHKESIADLELKRSYFLANFNQYFEVA